VLLRLPAVMRRAVKFDDQPFRRTVEVEDEHSDAVLAAEFSSIELSIL
jgi:hypothetical protein